MKIRSSIALTSVVAIVGLLAAAWGVSPAGAQLSRERSPAGTWFGSNSGGGNFIITISPWGQGVNRFSFVSEGLNNPDPAGAFGVVEQTSFRGELVRTGHNTYTSIQLSVVRDANYQLVGSLVSTGVVEMTSADTWEATFDTEGFLALPDDPFGDPFGDTPGIQFGSVTALYRRVPTD